jgi:hypothetical protein
MSARWVIGDTDIGWDGGVQHVPAGTITDVPPGSVLEAAYGGPANLEDLGDGAAAVPATAWASN